MRTAAICPTCATYTNAVCIIYDGPYLSNLDIAPLTSLDTIIQTIDEKVGDLQPLLGFTPENVANKSTNTSLGTSNTLYPTQNAVKTYVDAVDLQKVTDVNNYTTNVIQAEGGYDIWDTINSQWIEVRGSDAGFKAKVSGATTDFFIAEGGSIGIGSGTGTFGNILIGNLTPLANKSYQLPNISTPSKTLVTSVNGVDAGTDGNVNLNGYTGSIVVGMQTLNFTNGILTSVV
jgi:hypothetical protein